MSVFVRLYVCTSKASKARHVSTPSASESFWMSVHSFSSGIAAPALCRNNYTSAYASIRHQLWHCCPRALQEQVAPYVSIRQHTSAHVSIREHKEACLEEEVAAAQRSQPLHTHLHTTYVSIRQHTPENRLHTAYVSIRQHTSAYASTRTRKIGSMRTAWA